MQVSRCILTKAYAYAPPHQTDDARFLRLADQVGYGVEEVKSLFASRLKVLGEVKSVGSSQSCVPHSSADPLGLRQIHYDHGKLPLAARSELDDEEQEVGGIVMCSESSESEDEVSSIRPCS